MKLYIGDNLFKEAAQQMVNIPKQMIMVYPELVPRMHCFRFIIAPIPGTIVFVHQLHLHPLHLSLATPML